MKYTIGTDDGYHATDLIELAECLAGERNFSAITSVQMLTRILERARIEFETLNKQTGPDAEWQPPRKDEPLYGALLDLERELRQTNAQLSKLAHL